FPTNSTSTVVMIESDSQLSTSNIMKSIMEQIDASNKQLLKHPVQFTYEDLHTRLEPIIHKMIDSEYSVLFRQPVDPVALNIPDYPTIIKNPMDISTMHNKLLCGEYKNPLQFCDDAWLMFNNAWLFNRRSSRAYKMCTQLSQLFVESIDPVLKELGYCCGQQYIYIYHLLCYVMESNNAAKSHFNLSNDVYRFCFTCFNSIKTESIFIGDDPTQTLVEIPKKLFLLAINDKEKPEIMIDCIVCTRRWHQVCALNLDQIWSKGFICNTCVCQYNIKRKKNCYIAQKLIATDLSSRLEQRVNKFLHDKDCYDSRVTIRVLASSDKQCKVKPQLKKYYSNQIVYDNYPYRTKAIFAFQEIEGVDVIFFGMYVQEYDEYCPPPNTRRVYISHLDTVPFF
ncbi:unnamed protein product, partial [Rotaria sordida]